MSATSDGRPSAAAPVRPPRPARAGRRRAVLLGLALGVIALLAGTGTWVQAATSSAARPDVPVAVVGTVAAPGAGAGGLVVAAAALALALGGRWGSRVAAVGTVLGGLLVTASAAGVLVDPRTPALSGAREAVGVAVLTGPAAATALPWLAAACGVGAVVLGGWLLVRGVAPAAARHEIAPTSGPAPAGAAPSDPAPADPAPGGAAPADPAPGGAAPSATAPSTGTRSPGAPGPAAAGGRDDDLAAWDALSRGEDPT